MAEDKTIVYREEKEKFTSEMEDKLLIAQIQAWEKEAEDYWSQLKRVVERNLQYYYGNQTDVHKIYGKSSKAVENRIFMAAETMIPIATSRLPDIVVKPGQEDEQSQMDAQDQQDVLAYQMERVQIQSLAERFLRDMILKRFGVFKVKWDKNLDDVGLEVTDPKRIRIPKYGKTVNELAFILEDLEISYGQAEEFFGKDAADKLLSSQGTTKNSENKVRDKTLSIQEVWTNETRVYRAGSEILKKEPNPYWREDGENFFDTPKKPYIIKSLFETRESIIGDTDYVSQMISIQDNINTRKRQIENIAAKVANPPLLIDSEVMSEEEASSITNEEGFILYGKDAAKGDKIRFESPGQLPQYLFQDLEFSRREFDNIWGIHSTTRGEREPGRETATGRQMMKQADLGRIDLVARQLERALDEIAEYWTQLIKLFYTDDKAFAILGEDGIRFVKNFSGKKVGKGVKPMVKTGSTLKEDEFTIAQKAILLWQSKAIGVRTLYKMLKLPNMGEAVDDFIQTQSGQILQQGGQQAVVPPAQPVGGIPPQAGMGGIV